MASKAQLREAIDAAESAVRFIRCYLDTPHASEENLRIAEEALREALSGVNGTMRMIPEYHAQER